MAGLIEITWNLPDSANFRNVHGAAFTEWMIHHATFAVAPSSGNSPEFTNITFDQAYVVQGLHGTTSRHDPNQNPHATIRLSTPWLRDAQSWYTLHWRPHGGDCKILPDLEDESSRSARRARDKSKRNARKERWKRGGDRGGGRGGIGGGSSMVY